VIPPLPVVRPRQQLTRTQRRRPALSSAYSRPAGYKAEKLSDTSTARGVRRTAVHLPISLSPVRMSGGEADSSGLSPIVGWVGDFSTVPSEGQRWHSSFFMDSRDSIYVVSDKTERPTHPRPHRPNQRPCRYERCWDRNDDSIRRDYGIGSTARTSYQLSVHVCFWPVSTIFTAESEICLLDWSAYIPGPVSARQVITRCYV
jgi:hypothetical protein